MKSTRLSEVLVLAACALPFAYLAFLWPSLPETVPTHFDAAGNPNGWSSRSSLPLFLLLVTLLPWAALKFLPKIDPKRNFETFPENFQRLRLVIGLAMAGIGCIIVHSAAHPGFRPGGMVAVAVSILLMGLGNYLTTVRPNYFVGIRTPWTLESAEVWRKTHQLGGRLLFGAGVLGLLGALLLPEVWRIPLVVGLAVGASLASVVYSYLVYKKGKEG